MAEVPLEEPRPTGKAFQVLCKQKSFMGQINEKLNLDDFQVPGLHPPPSTSLEKYSSSDESSFPYQLQSQASPSRFQPSPSSSSQRRKRIGNWLCCQRCTKRCTKGEDGGKVITVRFRFALVVVVILLVLIVCGSISVPGLLFINEKMKSQKEMRRENAQDSTQAWTTLSWELYVKYLNSLTLKNRALLESVSFLAVLQTMQRVQDMVSFRRMIDPSFDGRLLNATGSQWNQSVGPAISFVWSTGIDTNLAFSLGSLRLLESVCYSWESPVETLCVDHGGADAEWNETMFLFCQGVNCTRTGILQATQPPYPDFGQYEENTQVVAPENELVLMSASDSSMYSGSMAENGIWRVEGPLTGSNYLQIGLFKAFPCMVSSGCSNALPSVQMDIAALDHYVSGLNWAISGLADSQELDSNVSISYVVYNGLSDNDEYAGYLLGESLSLGLNEFTPVTQSQNVLIAQSSQLVEQALGGWGFRESSAGKRPFGTAWSWSGAYEWSSFEVCDIDAPQKCRLVSASSLFSGNGSASNSVELILVTVFEQDLFQAVTRNISEIESLNQFEEDDHDKDTWESLTLLFMLLTFLLILFVCAFAIWFSNRFGRSVLQLSSLMSKLQDLKFRKIQPGEFSHIEEINSMQVSYNDMSEVIQVLEKFVPSAVVGNIVKNHGGRYRRLHVDRKNVTIMFSDIQGFTSIAEALSYEELVFILTKYLTVMTHIVEAYGGVVGEILGDGILAFWNTPETVVGHQAKACASALAQVHSMEQLNAEFAPILGKYELSKFNIRIGINTGKVLTGNIGSLSKMKFGCIGDAINLASRLEGICKLYGTTIVCSDTTFASLPAETFVTRELDLVQVKGKLQPVKIYEIVGMREQIEDSTKPFTLTSQPSETVEPKRKSTKLKLFPASMSSTRKRLNSDEYSTRFSSKFMRWSTNRSDDQTSASDPPSSDDASSPEKMLYGPVEFFENTRLTDIELYEIALHQYQAGDFAQADASISAIKLADAASSFLKSRIADAMKLFGDRAPEEENWHGVLRLDKKEFEAE